MCGARFNRKDRCPVRRGACDVAHVKLVRDFVVQSAARAAAARACTRFRHLRRRHWWFCWRVCFDIAAFVRIYGHGARCDQLGGVCGGIRQPPPPHCRRRFSAGPGNREWHGAGHARDGHTDNGGRSTSRCICGSDMVCCRLHITLRASLLAKLAIGERLLLRRADLGLLERLRREFAFRPVACGARVWTLCGVRARRVSASRRAAACAGVKCSFRTQQNRRTKHMLLHTVRFIELARTPPVRAWAAPAPAMTSGDEDNTNKPSKLARRRPCGWRGEKKGPRSTPPNCSIINPTAHCLHRYRIIPLREVGERLHDLTSILGDDALKKGNRAGDLGLGEEAHEPKHRKACAQ